VVTNLDVLDASAAEAIAALCARALARPPSADEVAGTLFAPEQPAVVRGDPSVGVVASVAALPDGTGASLRLLVVDPSRQGQGLGTSLLAAAEDDVRRGEPGGPSVTITVGADGPYFLFPGVETTQTAMVCLLEGRHYQRGEANFNMDVDLRSLRPDPGGTVLAGPDDRPEVDAWLADHWANWRAEALRALDKGTLLIERDTTGISAFCAWDVNRRGLVGPVAVRGDLIGKGRGVAVLVGALHRIRAAGRDHVEVCWVGPAVPYARQGATIGRVFLVYRKKLR
jgi:GNAT superfamily N-acetyltransferase